MGRTCSEPFRVSVTALNQLQAVLGSNAECRGSRHSRSTSGIRLALCRMQPVVYEVFKISGFTEILAIFPTREEAVRSLDS